MPSAGGRMPRACDAIDMDGDLVCNLVEEHPGAHNDPIYGEWFSTERALLADMREGDDFPCCGPGGHGHQIDIANSPYGIPGGVDPATGRIIFPTTAHVSATMAAVRAEARRARKAVIFRRRGVTKT